MTGPAVAARRVAGPPVAAPGGWDDVVVGAGSAGAVLASRLAGRGDRRVLLLEAGGELPASSLARPLGHSILSGANWDYVATLDGVTGREFPYPVGKVLGGSSAVNAAIALRALPADFDGWAAAGNPDWAWDRVREHIGRWDGCAESGGSVPIEWPSAQPHPLAAAFLSAGRAHGLPYLPNPNATAATGVGPLPSNASHGRRMSTRDTHLAAARHRPNLSVRTNCPVTRVVLAGGRVVGLDIVPDGGAPERISADRVTLCAGAVNTPVILQRSGIGAAARLAAVGITPLVDLPGVGENLGDHAVLAMWALPAPGIDHYGPWHEVMARVASDGGSPDLALFLAAGVTDVRVPLMGEVLRGRPGVCLSTVLLAPSARGHVRVVDATADSRPTIRLPLPGTADDVERLGYGARLAWSLLRSMALARVFVWTDRMVNDETLLASAIRRFTAPMWHPCGTARMGAPGDALSVVDQRCRVHTVDGLSVVDASVLPSVPRATPHLTCVMLAERVAEWM